MRIHILVDLRCGAALVRSRTYVGSTAEDTDHLYRARWGFRQADIPDSHRHEATERAGIS